MGFVFSGSENDKIAEDRKYGLVLKFTNQRPPITVLRANIIKFWGFTKVPMISFMYRYHVLLHVANERDYFHVGRKGCCGLPIWTFQLVHGFQRQEWAFNCGTMVLSPQPSADDVSTRYVTDIGNKMRQNSRDWQCHALSDRSHHGQNLCGDKPFA